MAVAMIWGSPGSGKTVAATAAKGEKILHLCSDNSAIVLDMFDRPDVTRERVEHWIDPGDGNYFSKQFEDGLASKKYTLIVVDNLTDLKELRSKRSRSKEKSRISSQICPRRIFSADGRRTQATEQTNNRFGNKGQGYRRFDSKRRKPCEVC